MIWTGKARSELADIRGQNSDLGSGPCFVMVAAAVAADRLARYDDMVGAAGLPGQGAVGGRDVLERGGLAECHGLAVERGGARSPGPAGRHVDCVAGVAGRPGPAAARWAVALAALSPTATIGGWLVAEALQPPSYSPRPGPRRRTGAGRHRGDRCLRDHRHCLRPGPIAWSARLPARCWVRNRAARPGAWSASSSVRAKAWNTCGAPAVMPGITSTSASRALGEPDGVVGEQFVRAGLEQEGREAGRVRVEGGGGAAAGPGPAPPGTWSRYAAGTRG